MAYPHAIAAPHRRDEHAVIYIWRRAPTPERRRAQVLGVKQYLEKLQSSQTFYKNSVGNSKVAKSGHVYAKVKFGDFTKEAYDEWRAKGGKKLPNQMY